MKLGGLLLRTTLYMLAYYYPKWLSFSAGVWLMSSVCRRNLCPIQHGDYTVVIGAATDRRNHAKVADVLHNITLAHLLQFVVRSGPVSHSTYYLLYITDVVVAPLLRLLEIPAD